MKVGEFVLKFYIYKINPDEEQTVSSMNEELQSKLADMKQDGVVATTYYLLPSKEFFGLWESLPYKSNVEELVKNIFKKIILLIFVLLKYKIFISVF